MRLLRTVALVALLACNKSGSKSEPGVAGSAGSAGSASAAGSAGSAAGSADTAGSAVPPVTIDAAAAGSAAPGAASPELAKAIDDADRWLAPIFKLSAKERFKAFCAALPDLTARAAAIQAAPAPAGVSDWATYAESFKSDVGTTDMCCKKPTDDASNDDCINGVHESFERLVGMVPGAPAVDAHAGDPLMSPAKK